MGFELARCGNCSNPLPRQILGKRKFICRECGAMLKNRDAIDLSYLLAIAWCFAMLIVGVGLINFGAFDYSHLASWLIGIAFFIVMLAVPAIVWFFNPYLTEFIVTDKRPHCLECEYILEANAKSCPECGALAMRNQEAD